MNAALVSRIVSSIPERTPRSLSGTAFNLDGARACSDPARLAGIVRLLQWLTPLTPLSQDEQRALGAHGLNGGLHAGMGGALSGAGGAGALSDDDIDDEPGQEASPMEESLL
jgi:hypothetical protein